MPPLGPFDEAELFNNFEQSGKRALLDLYNVSFFCGALDEQGKPFGDIGLDDLIDSSSSRSQKMQEDMIWTGTATIKEKDRAYKHLFETGQINRIAGLARRERPYTGLPQWKVGVEIRFKGKYYLHGFGEPDSNFRFEISLTQNDRRNYRRNYKLLTLTPDCMQRSFRAMHQASIMAFMCKAETKMGSKPLEWYEKEYMKAFPRNKVPVANVGEPKPVHRREFYSAIAMHFDDPVFRKDIMRKQILSRQAIEEFKVKRERIMKLAPDERQVWGLWPPVSVAEQGRSWKPDRNYKFPRLARPNKQQPRPSHLPVERHPSQVITILDSDDDEKDSVDMGELMMEEQAIPETPTPPALHNTFIQSPIQVLIRAPAPTHRSSVRPPRRVSDPPRRTPSFPSSSRSRTGLNFPVYERSPSPLGGYATYRPKDHKGLGNTRDQRERFKKLAQDGMFKQDSMDDNYVWICPVETCRHVFKMKESESWTEEVKRNVTPSERRFMETQTWRYGNKDANQIIEQKIMRPHYEMHTVEYGFGFKSDKSALMDLD